MSTPNIHIIPTGHTESSYFLSTIGGLQPFALQCRDNSHAKDQLTEQKLYVCIYIFAELLLIIDDNDDPTYFFPYRFTNANCNFNQQEFIEQ